MNKMSYKKARWSRDILSQPPRARLSFQSINNFVRFRSDNVNHIERLALICISFQNDFNDFYRSSYHFSFFLCKWISHTDGWLGLVIQLYEFLQESKRFLDFFIDFTKAYFLSVARSIATLSWQVFRAFPRSNFEAFRETLP